MARTFFCDVKNAKGVTFVELAMVLVIIAIVSALAFIGPGFVSTDRIRGISRELLADLQWIRQAAMTQGPDAAAPQLIGFGIRLESPNRYRLFRFNDSNANFTYDGAAEEAALSGENAFRQRAVPSPLEFQVKSKGKLCDPQNDVLLFDHLGIPRQANLGFQQKSIIIHNPNLDNVLKKCISISFNRIREGIWDGSECKEQ